MNVAKPKCGHQSLKSDCHECDRFRRKWYQRIHSADPDWRDIEYGLENPERLYDPPATTNATNLPLTMDYYDRALEVFHLWVNEGRSKRDCLVAELFGLQNGSSGTERGISQVLKSKRLKPNSRFAVRQTIKEINATLLKIAQGHLGVEESASALYLLDSKPKKDEADGKENAGAASPTRRAA